MEIVAVNGNDKSWTKHRYILAFGAYGWTRLMVWANSLDDALDVAIDWIAENEPGLLCDNEVKEIYDQAIADGKNEKTAMKEAEVDTTQAGNESHYLNSWEWSILARDPTRAQILALKAE